MTKTEILTALEAAATQFDGSMAATEKQLGFLASLLERAFQKSTLAGDNAAFFLKSIEESGLSKRGASNAIDNAKAW